MRRLAFAIVGAFSFDSVLFEALGISHNSALIHGHHTGAQLVGSLAALAFGFVVGWGCGRD